MSADSIQTTTSDILRVPLTGVEARRAIRAQVSCGVSWPLVLFRELLDCRFDPPSGRYLLSLEIRRCDTFEGLGYKLADRDRYADYLAA
jgi:hypothetical protein